MLNCFDIGMWRTDKIPILRVSNYSALLCWRTIKIVVVVAVARTTTKWWQANTATSPHCRMLHSGQWHDRLSERFITTTLFHDLLLSPISQHSDWSELACHSTRTRPPWATLPWLPDSECTVSQPWRSEPGYVVSRGHALSVTVHYRRR